MPPKRKVPARRASATDKQVPAAPTAASSKRRGRPPKNAAAVAASTSSKHTVPVSTANPVRAGRGRPKTLATASVPTPTSTKRKREEEEPTQVPPKKRGRPARTDTTPAKPRRQLAKTVTEDTKHKAKPGPKPKAESKVKPQPQATSAAVRKTTNKAAVSAGKAAARKGRPPGSKNKPKSEKATKVTQAASAKQARVTAVKESTKGRVLKGDADSDAEDLTKDLPQIDEEDDVDTQYWLMKAEPDSRIVKGVDVGFSIDKLAAATEPEAWDGVRNYVARNNMRAMRKGDLALFYHSNCDVPGIVGVMRVVEEHAIDESAFNPEHPYYDEKSVREKPRWDCVKVEFVKKFVNIITLKEVKSAEELQGMQLASASYGRLSVQKVSSGDWKSVLKMAGEPEDLGVTTVVSGYEADTNGETDKEVAEDSVGAEDSIGVNDVDDEEAVKIAAYGSPNDPVEEEDLASSNRLDAELGSAPNGVAEVADSQPEPAEEEIKLLDDEV